MNDRKDQNLQIISGIDEDIIDRNTAKRIRYIKARHQARKKRFISLVAIAAVVAMLVSFGAIVLMPAMTKQVPVYTGMTVSSENDKLAVGDELVLLSSKNTLKNDSHHGQNSPQKDIEDIIEPPQKAPGTNGTLDIIEDSELYYAKQNEDIYITVHFDNPDNYTIMAFTINGKPYASYMFEYGSDYENIIIKVNVGKAEGIVDYTIDAIQYADRETLKYVEMKGDPTLSIAVYSERQPKAEITNETVGINELSFDVEITDVLDLIAYSKGKIKAVLSDGTEIVAEQELSVGEKTSVMFRDLKTSAYYQYAIVAEYDAFDKEGYAAHVLYKKEITTGEVIAFSKVESESDSIKFSLVWNENAATKDITSIELYLGDSKIKNVAVDAAEITDLLSNSEYRIVVSYLNNGATESIEYIVKTLKKAVPTVSVTQKGTQTSSSFEFTVSVTDTDKVGKIAKLELIHGEKVSEYPVETREFTNLLSDNEYTVRVTYVYDLGDGNGEHTVVKALSVKTKGNAIPSFEFANVNEDYTSVTLDIIINDPDSVVTDNKAELFFEDQLIRLSQKTAPCNFTDITSDTEYRICVTLKYDLGDGKGEQEAKKELAVKTKTREVSYKVNHYLENVNDDGFTLDITEDLSDMENTTVKPAVRSYVGFESPSVQTLTVLPDGSLSVNYYYTRNTYTLNLVTNGGDEIPTASIKYQADISGFAAKREGYTFGSWFSDAELTKSYAMDKMPAEDITLYAWWQEESKPEAFSYVYIKEEDHLKITGYKGNAAEVVIPAYIGGKPVAVIDCLVFGENSTLKKVTLGANVTEINWNAFWNCKNLTQIIGLSNVTFIGDSAFFGCKNLSGTLDLQNAKSIGASAFYDCAKIEGVILGNKLESIGDQAFSSCAELRGTVDISSLKSVAYGIFSQCVKLEGVIFSKELESIGRVAFSGCTNLSGIYDLSNVSDIGIGAFYGCKKLSGVILGEKLKTLGNDVFLDCTNLSGVIDLSSVRSIPGNAFKNCISLEGVVLGPELESVGNAAFESCARLSGTIDLSNVTSIGWQAFLNCKRIEAVIFGNKLVSIDNLAFYGCSRISGTVDLSSVAYIGEASFYECVNIQKIIFGDNPKIICRHAFVRCTGLRGTLDLSSVTQIYGGGFSGCSGIEAVILGSELEFIGQDAFALCDGITDFYYRGSEEQWNNDIIQETGWDSVTGPYTVHYNYSS